MPTYTLMSGAPGSGKSTKARAMQALDAKLVRVNRDDLRASMYSVFEHGETNSEAIVTSAEIAALEEAFKRGQNVVDDNTNLSKHFVKRKVALAFAYDYTVVYDDSFKSVSYETLLERNAARPAGKQLPLKALQSFHSRAQQGLPSYIFEQPSIDRSVAPAFDVELEDAILVDIDGTVANHDGVRSPYDTSRYALDMPHVDVMEAVKAYTIGRETMTGRPCRIVFLSGRHVDFYDVTKAWLDEHFAYAYDDLIMREHEGLRDDVEKLYLYNKYVRNEYNVLAVFDDRDRVVKAWRSIGLRVFQVNEGDF